MLARCIDRPLNVRRLPRIRGRRQHREVLETIRPIIRISQIVRRDPERRQIYAEAVVEVNAVAQDPVATGGWIEDNHPCQSAERDDVAGSRRRPSHFRQWRAIDADAVAGVSQRLFTRRINADDVTPHDVAGRVARLLRRSRPPPQEVG